ncbi:MAG: PilW family protein, partial [Candidatus Adiutrix sp.]
SKYGALPIFGMDDMNYLKNQTGLYSRYDIKDGSDILTVCWLGVESAVPLGTLAMNFKPSLGELTLTENVPDEAGLIRGGDMLALVHENGTAMVFQAAENPISPSARHIINMVLWAGDDHVGFALGGVPEFPEGTLVYNLKTVRLVTYYLDKDNYLMADYHGTNLYPDGSDRPEYTPESVILANNIEDFQVRYILNDETPDPELNHREDLTGFDFNDNSVKGVRLGIVSRSPFPDPSGLRYGPITMFNNTQPIIINGATQATDNFRRRALINTINIRNAQGQ